HRDLADLETDPLCSGLGFGDTDPTQLRIGKDRVGDDPMVDGQVPALDQVGVDDLVVVVGDVSECRTSFDIPECPDTGYAGLQAAVYLHKAALVGFDSCLFQSQIPGGGGSSGG